MITIMINNIQEETEEIEETEETTVSTDNAMINSIKSKDKDQGARITEVRTFKM